MLILKDNTYSKKNTTNISIKIIAILLPITINIESIIKDNFESLNKPNSILSSVQKKQDGKTERYITSIQNQKDIQGLNNNYKKLYINKTKKILKNKLPTSAEKIINKFIAIESIDIEKILPKTYLYKNLLLEDFGKIKNRLIVGIKRLIINYNNIVPGVNFDGLLITISIPNTIKVGESLINKSLSFTYNPDDKKIYIEFFGFSKNGFGNEVGGMKTPIGSFTGLVNRGRISDNLDDVQNTELGKDNIRGFRILKEGIDVNLNSNSLKRSILSHGINLKRREQLNSGKIEISNFSEGCSIYATNILSSIYKKSKNPRFIEEITFPINN